MYVIQIFALKLYYYRGTGMSYMDDITISVLPSVYGFHSLFNSHFFRKKVTDIFIMFIIIIFHSQQLPYREALTVVKLLVFKKLSPWEVVLGISTLDHSVYF